ncbi:MAG: hypothetical protein ACP5XB_08785 [Isosphaeraceae bacterium]
MPTEERIKELELLIRGTSKRTLRWETTVDEDAFRLSSPIANIRLASSEGFDQEANEPFISRSLTVFNDRSRVVEQYYPEAAAEQSRFDVLFQLARRSACKTDEILDGPIDQIRDLVEA